MATARTKLADMYRDRKTEALEQLEALTPALEGGDPDALAKVRTVAHGLSGVCGAFGEPELGLLASAAEELARDPESALADLHAALQTLRAGLAEAL
jgi:HPt (histidine-containing phosphotransfer) domain-containing protein